MSKKDTKPSRVLDLEGKDSDGRLFATFHELACKSEETRYAHWHCHGSRWISFEGGIAQPAARRGALGRRFRRALPE